MLNDESAQQKQVLHKVPKRTMRTTLYDLKQLRIDVIIIEKCDGIKNR